MTSRFLLKCLSYEIRVMTSSAAFALTAAKRAPGRHPEGTRPVGAGRGKPQQRGENRSGVHPDSVSIPYILRYAWRHDDPIAAAPVLYDAITAPKVLVP